MNIGFDASRAFVNQKTGTENYSYQLLKHLSQIDHTNNYYIYLRYNEARGDGEAGPKSRPQRSCYERGRTWDTEPAGPRARNWPSNFKFIPIQLPRLWTQAGLALQTFKDPLDLLFVPAHTLPIIRKPNLKTLITVHDLGAEYLPTTHQIKQRFYLKFMTYYQLKSSSHIIAVSKATKDDLINKAGLDPSKITVVYEGYDNKLYKPVKGDTLLNTLKSYDLDPKSYFLFVGTIQPRKNLERLIHAYAKWVTASGVPHRSPAVKLLQARTSDGAASWQDPQALPKLILVGKKGWLSDPIYELPKKLGIEERVKFLGFVPDKDMPALYSGAKAFLFPSLFEGFGLPILEAMACGCPVLTSNLSSMPEVAGDGAILVDPYSVDSIVRGLIQVATPGVAAHLVKKGFQQVKKFSWQKTAQETLKIFLHTLT